MSEVDGDPINPLPVACGVLYSGDYATTKREHLYQSVNKVRTQQEFTRCPASLIFVPDAQVGRVGLGRVGLPSVSVIFCRGFWRTLTFCHELFGLLQILIFKLAECDDPGVLAFFLYSVFGGHYFLPRALLTIIDFNIQIGQFLNFNFILSANVVYEYKNYYLKTLLEQSRSCEFRYARPTEAVGQLALQN